MSEKIYSCLLRLYQLRFAKLMAMLRWNSFANV